MQRLSMISVLTATVMIALAAGVVFKGAQIARFAWIAQTSDDSASPDLAAYADTMGLRAAARLTQAPRDRLDVVSPDAIADVLAVEPTGGFYWLALASALQDEGAPLHKTLAAVRMSALTEPREAATMAPRATFLLSLWERVPASERKLAIADLAEIRASLPGDDRVRIRVIMNAKSEPVRAEIREALLTRTRGDRGFLAQVGL